MTDPASKQSSEQDFLNWFSENFRGNGLNSRYTFGNLHSYCTSFSEPFQGHEIAGHGHDQDASMAALKAAAELFERRCAIEFFRRQSDLPLKNTNGWAVHLSRESAIKSATSEAIERHILLYTYLRSGWDDFILLEKRDDARGTAYFLASPFIQNSHFGGIVIYRNHKFPGVSFGHLADDINRLQSSPRWNHALFEAVGFIERGLETQSLTRDSENELHKESCGWLLDSWKEPRWKRAFEPSALPNVEIEAEAGLASDLTDSYLALYYARVKLGNLLPLYTSADLQIRERREFVSNICDRYGVKLSDRRIPIL